MDFDGGLSVPPPPAQELGILDPQLRRWVDRQMTPQPLNADRTALRLSHPIGNGRPVTYIRCIDPPLPIVKSSADYARSRHDWRYIECLAGHEAIVTHAQEVAEIFLHEGDLPSRPCG